MQLDQMSLLQEKINKVVLLARQLREENKSLKAQLAEAQDRLEELEADTMAVRLETNEKQKALSAAIGLLDSMLEDASNDGFLPSDQDQAVKYLAGDEH